MKNKFITPLVMAAISLILFNCKNESSPVYPSAPESESDRLGLLSDTTKGLKLDTDSFLGTFGNISNNYLIISEDSTILMEGPKSLKISIKTNKNLEEFAGWFICWGPKALTGDNKCTLNMSDYRTGTVEFWIKSPINLLFSIRSGNISEGEELSKILLSEIENFVPDNNWHHIKIPLSLFSSSADFTKIKVFFTLASNLSSGGTNDSLCTYWIDDLIWRK